MRWLFVIAWEIPRDVVTVYATVPSDAVVAQRKNQFSNFAVRIVSEDFK
jgi:hypothetical protein